MHSMHTTTCENAICQQLVKMSLCARSPALTAAKQYLHVTERGGSGHLA
jgi:hypothetical protein